jgi:hypothetical protein
VALLAPTLVPQAHAQGGSIAVVVDNKPVNFGGVPPIQSEGRLLVPLRSVFEALGASVEFIPEGGYIRSKRGDTQLQLALGSNQAYVNGQPRTLDVPAQAVLGRTLVPLRFVAEAFGAQVQFNNATQTVEITSPPSGNNGGGTGYNAPGAGQTLSGTLVKVDSTPPATITISADGTLRVYPLANGALILRQLSVAASATATPVRQPARAMTLANLNSGDPVRVTINDAGQVTQIISPATVIIARVQFAGGGQIVLDDERDTTLTIGPNLRYIDPQGRPSNVANLPAGQSVGLFISRENRTIYMVSAYPPDMASSGGTPDPIENGQLPPANTPQIQLVQHNADAPLRAGSRLLVTVRGTPGLRGVFNVGPKIVNQPLTEDPTRPGVYTGQYVVRAGDDVLNVRVGARLTAGANLEDFKQSDEDVTIDTVPPRLLGTFPANGAQINTALPNITIFADDLNGSGLGGATLDIISGPQANPQTVRVNATVAPPTAINAVPPQAITGPVGVRAVVTDKAGNALNVDFGFTIIQGTNLITSFTHGANRAMQAGEDIPLQLNAPPAGRATVDVLNGRGTVFAKGLPLTDTQPGRYQGSFRVPANPPGALRFVGRYVGPDGTPAQLEATTRVEIVQAPTQLTVDAPADEERVTSPVVIKGKAAPNAIIDVSLRAEGTQFFILEYKEELGTQQVRADANGNWQTKPIDLPARRNVADLRYVVTTTQTDAANRQSDPVTITIRTK